MVLYSLVTLGSGSKPHLPASHAVTRVNPNTFITILYPYNRSVFHSQYSTSTHHFIVFHFIVLHRCCCCFVLFCFTNWRFMATVHWTSLLAPFFPTALAHFVSLCHILVILTIFRTFIIFVTSSEISDLWCYYCSLFCHFLAIKYFLLKYIRWFF